MPKLVLKKRAEIIAEINLLSTRDVLTIGTDPGNDLVVDDQRVSMNHLRIERQSRDFYVWDLKSAFGTYLNGHRIVNMERLRHGDELQLGEHTLYFDNPLEKIVLPFAQEPLQDDPFTVASEKKIFGGRLRSTTLDTLEEEFRKESASFAAARRGDGNEMAPFYLLAIYGPYSGKRFQLKYGETRIGRDSKLNDIVIQKNKRGETDPSISRRHATISFHENLFFILDKRSKTRTYVNRMVVPEDGEIQLYPGDEIEIVSDQQSSIFRFVASGQWDFSPPRKAGVWWVRYKARFLTTASALVVLAGLFLMVTGFSRRAMLTQKPDPLSLELTQWNYLLELDRRAANSVQQSSAMPVHPKPAVSDFDGDGFVDLVALNFNQSPLLIDGLTKLPKWIVTTISAKTGSGLVAADVNQNGLDDLLFLSDDGRIVAIDGVFGAEIWSSPYFQNDFTGPPVAGDLDGDGLVDVAIADVDGHIVVGYNRSVDVDWQSMQTDLPIRTPLTCADLDGDGDVEILCGTERGLVLIIDGVKRNIVGSVDINEALNRARGTFYEDNQIRFPVGVADLTGDGNLDIVVSSVQGNIIAVNGATKQRLWHDALTSDLALNPNYPFPFAVADVSGDGLPDVVVATDRGTLNAYSGAGIDQQAKLLWQHTLSVSGKIPLSFAIGDLNKDLAVDVAFLDSANTLQLLNGRTGSILWKSAAPIVEPTSIPFIADLQNNGLL
ncbi:MAG: FHA domain-containing protein, partial [bacterium]